MLRSIGLPEMMAIAAVAILLFGGKRVGELGKGMAMRSRDSAKPSSRRKRLARNCTRMSGRSFVPGSFSGRTAVSEIASGCSIQPPGAITSVIC